MDGIKHRAQRPATLKRMEQTSLNWEPERRIYSVAEITGSIRGLLDEEFHDVWVSGEISGAKRAPSGHYYFTLKDELAQLQCACWRSYARALRFKPEDGMAVLARGHIDVYPQRGQYQLIVEALEPQGIGALQLAFEQLKKKLTQEGLFAQERKRPLPKFPRHIGIVTSPTGAAIRDLIDVLTRRWPGIQIQLYPSLVQGPGAAAAIVEGIQYFSGSGWADLLIAGRGGGSLEDLWAFNEEPVARAIAACQVPIISAVGHETDFTIADFVADARAPTPSAAAEIAVPERREIGERIGHLSHRLFQTTRYRISQAAAKLHQSGTDRAASLLRRRIGEAQQRVDDLEYRFRERVRQLLRGHRRRLDEWETRLRRQDLRLKLADIRRRFEQAEARFAERARLYLAVRRTRLAPLTAQLGQLSPLAVLERGYAIVQTPSGRAIRSAAEAPAGTALQVLLSKGRLGVRVERSEPEAGRKAGGLYNRS